MEERGTWNMLTQCHACVARYYGTRRLFITLFTRNILPPSQHQNKHHAISHDLADLTLIIDSVLWERQALIYICSRLGFQLLVRHFCFDLEETNCPFFVLAHIWFARSVFLLAMKKISLPRTWTYFFNGFCSSPDIYIAQYLRNVIAINDTNHELLNPWITCS